MPAQRLQEHNPVFVMRALRWVPKCTGLPWLLAPGSKRAEEEQKGQDHHAQTSQD